MANTNHKHSAWSNVNVGVTGLGFPSANYVPAKHNPPQPLRVGALDVFKLPSLDHTGTRKPYWGSQE